MNDPRAALARAAFDEAVASVSAARCLPPHLPPRAFAGGTYVLALGKAAGAMAEVAAHHLDADAALVIYPDGHGPRGPLPACFEQRAARHPVPDERGLDAAERALALAARVTPGDRLIALISGGGSALTPAPVAGVTIAAKQALTRALLASGAPIAAINTVRQCLSRIKGGRLAAAVAPGAAVITLAISDIPGDDVGLVASGPTLPSRATLGEARAILQRYGIEAPPEIAQALATPANHPPALDAGRAAIIARPMDALAAAAGFLLEHGYRPMLLGDAIEGEARALAAADAERALTHAARGERVALIAGGEAGVRLPPGAPPGGRNAEYALALAVALRGHPDIVALACDSDGVDGTSNAAGAIVTPETLTRMESVGISPTDALERHDTARAFAAIDAAIVTGPTRTNVNDVRIVLIG